MSDVSSIALSGMKAAQDRLLTSAHNIANLETQGFTRQDVKQSSAAGDNGTSTSISRNSNGEGANIESDLVYQLRAKNDFIASLSVLKTNNSMLGSLLDTTA